MMPRPDYKTNDPRGWCGDPSRGAALGRGSMGVPPRGATSDFDGELTLRHIHIDSGGYDPNGTYFGTGEPLYWFASDDGEIDAVLRASDRDNAERLVLALYPKATFRKFVDLDTFFAAYIECALWSSTDQADESGGEPLDANYNECDLTPEALTSLRKEAEAFATEDVVAPLIMGRESQAGHDFWLTRNGHGCGFWDGDWPKEAGKILTDRSHAYREKYIYVGDDKKLHV
jgi:hypothetical protein